MNYAFHLIVMIEIYLLLAYSLNLILGFGGLISFCHAAFYGIGAYVYAILITFNNFHPLTAFSATLLSTVILSSAIGGVSLRFRGDLFLFVTIGFQMIFFVIIYNWIGFTRGPYGIPGIPRISIFGIMLHTPFQYSIIGATMCLLVLCPLFFIYRSPFAILLKAIRENENAAASFGINTKFVYLQAFVISACIASIAGSFYATYLTYIDPTSFSLEESIMQVAILLFGGTGNKKGPFWGVVIMMLLPEVLTFVGLPDAQAHNVRKIIYGLLLTVIMYFRPQGMAGEFKLT